MADSKHWVEDLFPPAFKLCPDEELGSTSSRYGALDVDASNTTVLKDLNEKKHAEPVPTVFEQVASNFSSLDVSGIRNVYERVWLMTALKEEEERKQSEKAKLDSISTTSSKVKRCKDVSTSTADLVSSVDPNDSCIWNSGEIDMLRAVFKTTKEQNTQYKSILKAYSEDLANLQEKHKNQCKLLEAQSQKLNEAVKANKRFHILTTNYKDQLQKENERVKQLEDGLEKLTKIQKDSDETIHKLRMEVDKEQLKRKHMEIVMEKQHQEATQELYMHEENLKLHHEQDIEYLKRKIGELQSDLLDERKSHERSKKGLEHLRQHFSSLPMADVDVSGARSEPDQLTNWTY